MPLLDVLLSEQLVEIFLAAARRRKGLNATLLPESPEGIADMLGERGAAVRIETRAGASLLVTPRRIAREVGDAITDLVPFGELEGYDWIDPDLAEKVRLKDEHGDRLFVYLSGTRTVVLEGLGEAVYPLMTYLGKALELRSQKLLLRRLDAGIVEVVDRCLRAAAEGPFFADDELDTLFEQDRASLQVLAAMWQRMNLAAPDLRRTVVGVVEMLLERQPAHTDAWDTWIGFDPTRVRGAVEVFRRVVAGEVGEG